MDLYGSSAPLRWCQQVNEFTISFLSTSPSANLIDLISLRNFPRAFFRIHVAHIDLSAKATELFLSCHVPLRAGIAHLSGPAMASWMTRACACLILGWTVKP